MTVDNGNNYFTKLLLFKLLLYTICLLKVYLHFKILYYSTLI